MASYSDELLQSVSEDVAALIIAGGHLAKIDSDDEFFSLEDSEESSSSSGSDYETEDEDDSDEESVDEAWSLQRSVPPPPAFTSHEELLIDDSAVTPFDFFRLLFTDQILQQIVDATNDYASQMQSQLETPIPENHLWKPLTIESLLTFIGILLHMGHKELQKVTDHFFRDILYYEYMPQTEFLLIFKYLRFGPQNLDSLVTYFNERMRELYIPGEELSIEQITVTNCGHYRSHHEIINKKCFITYNTKIYTLETQSGVSLKINLCHNKREQEVSEKDSTNKAVMKLLDNFFNTGRHVYMNSHFNSFKLSELLLRNGMNVTGTLKAKCRGIPAVIKTKLPKGGSIYRYNSKGVCVCKWQRNHRDDVLTISTIHSPDLKKIGKKVLKPEMVIKFNRFMRYVDKYDENMWDYYTCNYKPMRTYKKIGIHIFQMMMLNAYYLYQMKLKSKLKYGKFRDQLFDKILCTSPNENEPTNKYTIHLPEELPIDKMRNAKKRKCEHCWNTANKRVDTIYYCSQCDHKPGLCLECFREYHNY